MVGTFYRASAPGAAPFADIGKSVAKGDTLCIIEAMKLLNEIESDLKARSNRFWLKTASRLNSASHCL
jgi:acetyl-CoA carboxylase biotin carboxyl carrier protein